jgi:aspartate racemase
MTRTARRERSFGVVGGLAPQADADLMRKLAVAAAAHPDGSALEFAYDPRLPTSAAAQPASSEVLMSIYDGIDAFERQGSAAVVLPLFLGAAFAGELQSNSPLPIVGLLDALRHHVRTEHPDVRRIGLLQTVEQRQEGVFDAAFPASSYQLLHPRDAERHDRVRHAVYGESGLAAVGANPGAVALLREACADLVAQGAELILPGAPEIALVADELTVAGVPVVDHNRAYAEVVVAGTFAPIRRPFKLGVVGGVGPAATLDFLQKVMRNTPARRDQDHLRIVVEQNPQIPDRTEHLVGDGIDPTLALYATCKKLQAGDADLIAIPCNTAHAFVEEIQSHLDIPIMNMLTVTVAHVRETFPGLRRVGLLATSGTVASGVYRRALSAQGLEEVVPDPALQQRVMNAIYGPAGVKAGHTTGECVADVAAAIDGLAAKGVEVVILGCTELPLLRRELETRGGPKVTLVDPTEILAVRCVSMAAAWTRA